MHFVSKNSAILSQEIFDALVAVTKTRINISESDATIALHIFTEQRIISKDYIFLFTVIQR